MPERVKITFDDSDKEESQVEQQVKKRKAEEAFGSSKIVGGGNDVNKITNNRQNRNNSHNDSQQSDRNKIKIGSNGKSNIFRTDTNSGTILAKHRQKRQDGNKVVDFRDGPAKSDSDDKSKIRKNGKTNNQHGDGQGQPEILGRLKRRAAELLKTRQQLPIWTHADEVRNKVKNHDVLLLVGETGSGKSTQIPQFLLPLCRRVVGSSKASNGAKVGGCIAITQPRRVAAISLARRVAEEMGTPLGDSSPASQVGYSVRFDSSVGPSTRVKFLTDGMLLQELVRDPWLKEYSVVVVDEVHERGVNVDLVLGFLKRLIEGRSEKDGRGGVGLKVVVMSATADMEKIKNFFGPENVGILNGNENENGESTVHGDGESKPSDTPDEKQPQDLAAETSKTGQIKVAACYIKGRQYPVTLHYTPIPLSDVLDAAMERIINIHSHTPLPGDVLVFLPGQETIDSLESMCVNFAQSLAAKSKVKGAPRLPKLLILPLFAALPTALQQQVFEPTPPFTRKIILSTNIAETSVTVPGIRHVIDTGKRKARFFRPGLNLDTLLTKSISRSSANQRAGRAGREAAGNCYRLYTEKSFYELEADTEPEILRCDLSQLVLTLKAHHIDNIVNFPLLTPPPGKALERALLHLLRLKALDRQTGEITQLGRQMSKLPLPANLARVLIASRLPQLDCVEEMIDIVSGLSVENIWLPLHNSSTKANTTINRHSQQQNSNDHTHEPLQSKSNDTSTTNNRYQDLTHNSNGNNHNINDEDEENLDPITQARQTLQRREGDHLTLLATIQAYTAEHSDRRQWCRQHGINHRAMTSLMEIRKQLTKLLFQSNTTAKKQNQNQNENQTNEKRGNESGDKTTRILKTLLLGLSENVACLSSSLSSNKPSSSNSITSSSTNPNTSRTSNIWTGPYTTLSASASTNSASSRKNLSIHPSSVLFHRSISSNSIRPAYIMFSEFVVTGRAYARNVSAIEGVWLDELEKI